MAYNPPTFKGDPATGQTASQFSGLRTDGNRVAMTGVLGNYMQTRDATGTPVNSPLTATGSPQTLTVPSNAAQLVIVDNTSALDVSEDSTMTTFFNVPKGVVATIDVANLTKVYVQGTLSDSISFYFNMV